ncbi:MAG: SDR family NAD(P)-dependent oxidoreductase [Verrucomicrobia bacterium]|nr:SDR family NAD(P)-dependent oxidoreductase [Verrucomicrobiota bacterium]
MPNSYQSKHVLVTGAGGFIGSHLAERLVREGAKVTAMVHYNALGSNGWLNTSDLKNEMTIGAGDICDPGFMQTIIEGKDIVFHLAALIAIPYSYVAPESYVRTNVIGTLNVLQAACRCGTGRVLHTSTSEVYGTALYVPIDEKHPLQGQSPYSASKIGADKMAESFHRSFDLPCVTVRPFNTFGPRQSARAVIPTIISQILTNGVVKLGSLSPTRDLNYVDNTVDGFLAAGLDPAAIGQTISFGSGREISIGDLAALIARMVGKDVPVVQEADRLRPHQSEVERLLADNTLAKELLGWEPKTNLETGLARTIEWFRGNHHRYDSNKYTI